MLVHQVCWAAQLGPLWQSLITPTHTNHCGLLQSQNCILDPCLVWFGFDSNECTAIKSYMIHIWRLIKAAKTTSYNYLITHPHKSRWASAKCATCNLVGNHNFNALESNGDPKTIQNAHFERSNKGKGCYDKLGSKNNVLESLLDPKCQRGKVTTPKPKKLVLSKRSHQQGIRRDWFDWELRPLYFVARPPTAAAIWLRCPSLAFFATIHFYSWRARRVNRSI